MFKFHDNKIKIDGYCVKVTIQGSQTYDTCTSGIGYKNLENYQH